MVVAMSATGRSYSVLFINDRVAMAWKSGLVTVLFVLLGVPVNSWAEDDAALDGGQGDLGSLDLGALMDMGNMVTSATKTAQRIEDAPSVIDVVNERQIRDSIVVVDLV